MPSGRVWAVAGMLVGIAAYNTLAAAEPGPSFSREVRPILAAKCFACHGPDEHTREAGLRLDLREGATADLDGRHALVPGKPNESGLLGRVAATDPDERMPPDPTKALTAAEIDVLQRWIAAGAPYEPHWAFAPPVRRAPPAVKDPSWPRNEIDFFILAELERAGLRPSSEADKATLVRRLYLDLIGLPPTLEEADAFVRDGSPTAYEDLVDRLLASPRYGERWARRWLDLARYADTNGYEKDRVRSIWPYRDWVIRAFNDDLPFDRFTVEQLAGDLLPNPTPDQRIATGFHRNSMLNEEGGIDPLEFRFHALVDRTAVTATTWLGLTLGCAQCHTHKYDPITHVEYYRVLAFLDNTDEPDYELPSADRPALLAKRQAEAADLLAKLPSHWPLDEVDWHTPTPLAVTAASKQTPKLLPDGSALFAGETPDFDTYEFTLPAPVGGFDRLRFEALTDPALPANGPGRVKHGNFVLSELSILADLPGLDDDKPLAIRSATAEVQQDRYPISAAFDGDAGTGWAVHHPKHPLNAPKTAVFSLAPTGPFPPGTRLIVKVAQTAVARHTLGRIRLSLGRTNDAKPESLAARRTAAVEAAFEKYLAAERAALRQWPFLRPTSATSNSPRLEVLPDAAILASGDITKDDTYTLTFAAVPAGTRAFRLEALPDPRLPAGGPGLTYYEGPKGDFFLGEFQAFAGGKQLKFSTAYSALPDGRGGKAAPSATGALDGDPQTGWSAAGKAGETHQAIFVLAEPLAATTDLTLTLRFGRHYACSLGKFRLSSTTEEPTPAAAAVPERLAGLLRISDAELGAERRQTLFEEFLLSAPELDAHAKRIRELRKPPAGTTTLVMTERPPENRRTTHRRHRGEYLQPKEAVEPGLPSFLPAVPPGVPADRLALAKLLVSPDNPLTARVVVNRQWGILFGAGLVKSEGDFGLQGDSPSHPELLDFLATEWVRLGWSHKKLHRLIVTSATYRQSSKVSPEALAKDPQNRLLGRAPRIRLDAEAIRDAALRSAGLLSDKMYGPPVRPPQPAGVTDTAYAGGGWQTSTGEDRYRRGIYTFMKRTAPYAMFNAFDGPSGETCLAKREISNSPLQALMLLNDEVFLEAAQALGKLAQAVPGDDRARAEHLFRRCLTRPPQAAETEALLKFAAAQRKRIEDGKLAPGPLLPAHDRPADAAVAREWAVWTTVARALLNLDEAIVRN